MQMVAGERIALGFFALLITSAIFRDPIYSALWLLGVLLIGLIWWVAAVVAIWTLVVGLLERAPLSVKLRNALPMPIGFMLACVMWSPALAAGRWTFARVQLAMYQGDYDRRANGRPTAFAYLEGIPDGGVAIVRADHDPATFAASAQLALVGENIHWCDWLADRYYLCGYD